METIPYELRAGQLNQTYEKIKNCRVVKPPYDTGGFYTAEFFLDKRFGLEELYSDSTKNFIDYIDINGYRYYYYIEDDYGYIGTFDGDYFVKITPTGFKLNANSPRKLTYGRNIYGPVSTKDKKIALHDLAGQKVGAEACSGGGITVQNQDNYSGGYVKLAYTGTQDIAVGDYILFAGDKSVLRGCLNVVEDSDNAEILRDNLTTSNIVRVSPNKALFLSPGMTVTIKPGVGSTTSIVTTKVSATWNSIGDGLVTLDAAVNCKIGDILNYGELIYIIGTNARGSLPNVDDPIHHYKGTEAHTSNCIVVGHQTEEDEGCVSIVLLNGRKTANVVQVLKCKEEIIDIVNFDVGIFALTANRVYFSRSTLDDNTQFYPIDHYKVDGGYKLFVMGKVLLVFGFQNKLFAAANSTTQTIGYVGYDVNYNGNLFSKYSTIFTDQTIYVLQDDLQLMQIDIVTNSTTSYDLNVKNVNINTKGVFEGLEEWDCLIHDSTNYLNFIFTKDGDSIDYQYDKQYQHWLVNNYDNLTINKFKDDILLDGKICTVGDGFTDMGEPYKQEVNFNLNSGGTRLNMPYIIRTIFGLVDSIFSVNLDMNFEIGGKSLSMNRVFSNFDFDTRLSETLTGDEIIGYGTGTQLPYEEGEYNGKTVSLQSTILKTGRYISFKYNSYDRFCIGDSYVLTDFTKPFINEFNKTT